MAASNMSVAVLLGVDRLDDTQPAR
jgi:hypothetical protein